MSTATVTVERAVESQEWLTPELVTTVAELVVDVSEDVEVIASHVARAYHYQVLPGISNPRISPDGRVIDPDRRRAYSIPEIVAVLHSDACRRAIDALREERAAEAAEEKREARVEQLAQARAVKQARGEAELVPMLFEQVRHLTEVVERLVDQVDRGLVGANLEDVTVEKLPTWED